MVMDIIEIEHLHDQARRVSEEILHLVNLSNRFSTDARDDGDVYLMILETVCERAKNVWIDTFLHEAAVLHARHLFPEGRIDYASARLWEAEKVLIRGEA